MIGNMRITLIAAGALMVMLGVLWIGQGTRYFPYPSNSFMVGDTSWAYYGAALAIVGVLVIVFSPRQ